MSLVETDSLITRAQFTEPDSCTVLIVDDDELVREHLAALIGAAGYCVRLASTGKEALHVFDTEPVHIVVSDWEMPDMDGLALCQHIRARRAQNYTYVLMLTVRRNREDILAGLTAGADDYIIKGAETAELLARVNVGRRITTLERSLRKATRQNRRMALTDPLTGAWNRLYLMTYLPRELERARRHSHPISILMCDLDGFKRINDDFGHIAGDQVLEAFCSRASDVLRTSDWIARMGGEEFVIALPETDLAGAATVADKVRRAVCTDPILTTTGSVAATVSIGYSCFSTPDDYLRWQSEDLLHAADRQLYAAKRSGRNCCRGAAIEGAEGGSRACPGIRSH
jgi:diguanylate cyclase (GGDEF)-like protein